MPFDNDDTDYKALKEQRSQERQDISEIRDAFSLNLGKNPDRLLDILQGTYRPPSLPGEPDRITRPINERKFVTSQRNKVTMADLDDREGGGVVRRQGSDGGRQLPVNYAPVQQKYAEITSLLDRFTFSDNDEIRTRQMSVIASSIRKAMQELVYDEVARGTKVAFKKYAERVVKIPGGLKVYYDFNGNKMWVAARGNFFGSEIIGVKQTNGKIQGIVLQNENGSQSDLSDNFEISIGRV